MANQPRKTPADRMPGETLLERAGELDLRRQQQIRNQHDVINRLLAGEKFDAICNSREERIADLEREVELLKKELYG